MKEEGELARRWADLLGEDGGLLRGEPLTIAAARDLHLEGRWRVGEGGLLTDERVWRAVGWPDEDMSGFLCKKPRKKESVGLEVGEVKWTS